MNDVGLPQGAGAVIPLHFAGALDASAAAGIRERIAAAVEGRSQPRLLLDFAQVKFIDSMALGIVASAAAAVTRAGGEIVLCAMVPAVRRAFEVTQLHKVLDIVEDQATALRWLGAASEA